MGFNTTFNNISVISWRSVLLVEETGVPGFSQVTDKLDHNVEHLALSRSRSHNISGDGQR
jgi:hypothetical protein